MTNYSFTISLRVFGGGVSHSDISEAVGITARWSHRAGELRTDPKGNLLGGTYSADYCSIDLPSSDGASLPSAIQEQIEVLRYHKELFHTVQRNAGRIEIFVGWFGSTNFGEIFPSNLLKQLGELHIDLSVDIYSGQFDAEVTC